MNGICFSTLLWSKSEIIHSLVKQVLQDLKIFSACNKIVGQAILPAAGFLAGRLVAAPLLSGEDDRFLSSAFGEAGPLGATLAECDPFAIPSTSAWTGAAIIVPCSRTKTCIVTRPRTSSRPTPSSLAA